MGVRLLYSSVKPEASWLVFTGETQRERERGGRERERERERGGGERESERRTVNRGEVKASSVGVAGEGS